jgi:G2/mitotic-specific cyclin 3/4
MLRRNSAKPQIVNDENTNQVLSSKTNTETSKARSYQGVSTSANIQSTNASKRTVLGVVPDSALNSSQHLPSVNQSSQQHQANFNPHQENQQQFKSKIPVLIDNQSNQLVKSTSTSSDLDIQMDTSNVNPEQENIIDEDYANEVEVDADVDDVEYDEEEYEDLDIAPMSPIVTKRTRAIIDRVYQKYSREELDPNDQDTFDITMVAEYGNRIFNYLHDLELKYRPNPAYMNHPQDDLRWENRAVIMDWLVQLHGRFNLLPETLYLSVNIIDRFLSRKAISLSRFHLCAAVALLIAAKYEEINVPTVSQMVYMIGKNYEEEKTSFLKAEKFMVETLEFEFGWPGPMSFLRRGSKADDYDNDIRTMAKYFIEVTIMDARFVASPTSWIAAGSQYLARRALGSLEWTEQHVYYTGYVEEQLIPIAEVLLECCLNAETHHPSIFRKYSERRFRRVAVYVQNYVRELYSPENHH